MKASILNALMVPCLISFLVACGQDDSSTPNDLGPITKDEARSELNAVIDLLKFQYGPLEYKGRVVGFDLQAQEKAALQAIDQASSDTEIQAAFIKLGAALKDGHAGISYPLNSDHVKAHSIPIHITPLKDKNNQWAAIVDHVDESYKSSSKLNVGDTIIRVDGKGIFDHYLPIIMSYKSRSNDESDRHLIYRVFNRGVYMTELAPPASGTSMIDFIKSGGSEIISESWTWKKAFDADHAEEILLPEIAKRPGQLLSVSDAPEHIAAAGESPRKMGSEKPFFYTEQVKSKFQLIERRPSPATLKKFGIEKAEDEVDVFAATYEYTPENETDAVKILLIRQPGYVPPGIANDAEESAYYKAITNWIQTYKAIMYENSDADIVVVDQNNNPGGISTYVTDFFRLFIQKRAKGLVQLNNVDRLWYESFINEVKRHKEAGQTRLADLNQLFARTMETALSQNPRPNLSPATTFDRDFYLEPFDDFKWEKPVLVLADELAGSCGDIFPMLIKGNATAKIFGNRTMGLGGNVEARTLDHSRARFRITRGLFTVYNEAGDYSDDSIFVENSGVPADIQWEHTVEDFREGFVSYMKAVSEQAWKDAKGK